MKLADISMNKHSFHNVTSTRTDEAKRAATYYRVSTGRQFANDASIPSQRQITSAYCDQNNYFIAEEFIEAAVRRQII